MKLFIVALLALALSLCSISLVSAARISGSLTDSDGNPISGANVLIDGTTLGASADLDGFYEIWNIPAGSGVLKVSHIGYKAAQQKYSIADDDLQINIILDIDFLSLRELEVKASRLRSGLDREKLVRTEVIVSEDLQSNSTDGGVLTALSEETGLNTRPCALCGSAGIGLQGLDPSYTEINIDGMPMLSGLGTLYGLYGVSVKDISRVELQKGSGSSEYGAGAVAGAVNLVTTSDAGAGSLQLDVTGGSTLSHSLNMSVQRKLAGMPTRLSLNYGSEPERINNNHDAFTDTPQYSRFGASLSSSKQFGGSSLRISGRTYREQRFAGDVNWTKADRGSDSVYGREINTYRNEVSARYSASLNALTDWYLESAYVNHFQDSYYGATEFDAVQNRLFGRLGADVRWTGSQASRFQSIFTFEDYQDNLQLGVSTDKRDIVPGLMVQHTWTPDNFWALQGGVRLENYSDDGLIPTLRATLSHKSLNSIGFRVTAGTGYRPVTIFSLDKAVHAGFDNVIVPEKLDAERSYNGSLTLTHLAGTTNYSLQTDLTGFYTKFDNKVILAFGHDIGSTVYSNASDAYSRGIEFQTKLILSDGWDFKAGGTISEVRYRAEDGWHHSEMQNQYTANIAVKKQWQSKNINAEVNSNIYGPQQMPEGRSRSQSPVYAIYNARVVKAWRSVSLSAAVDNITDWVQPDPPFVPDPDGNGNVVDSALIYGPLLGRTFRVGLSYTLPLAN